MGQRTAKSSMSVESFEKPTHSPGVPNTYLTTIVFAPHMIHQHVPCCAHALTHAPCTYQPRRPCLPPFANRLSGLWFNKWCVEMPATNHAGCLEADGFFLTLLAIELMLLSSNAHSNASDPSCVPLLRRIDHKLLVATAQPTPHTCVHTIPR